MWSSRTKHFFSSEATDALIDKGGAILEGPGVSSVHTVPGMMWAQALLYSRCGAFQAGLSWAFLGKLCGVGFAEVYLSSHWCPALVLPGFLSTNVCITHFGAALLEYLELLACTLLELSVQLWNSEKNVLLGHSSSCLLQKILVNA